MSIYSSSIPTPPISSQPRKKTDGRTDSSPDNSPDRQRTPQTAREREDRNSLLNHPVWPAHQRHKVNGICGFVPSCSSGTNGSDAEQSNGTPLAGMVIEE